MEAQKGPTPVSGLGLELRSAQLQSLCPLSLNGAVNPQIAQWRQATKGNSVTHGKARPLPAVCALQSTSSLSSFVVGV